MSDNFILETNRLINNLPLFAVGSYKTEKNTNQLDTEIINKRILFKLFFKKTSYILLNTLTL